MLRAVIAVSVALGLAACGQTPNTAAAPTGHAAAASASILGEPTLGTITGPDGDAGQVVQGPEAAADLPDFAAIYPESVVTSGIKGAGPEPGGTVVFHSAASPDEVVAFYRNRAKASDMTDEVTSGDAANRIYSAQSEKQSLQVIATRAKNGEGSDVQLFWSLGG